MLYDYVQLVRDAILTLAENNLATRRELYSRLRTETTASLSEEQPPMDDDDIALHQRLMEHTIRLIEADIRRGIDISADGYRPAGLDKVRGDLEVRRQQSLDRLEARKAPPVFEMTYESIRHSERLSQLLERSDDKSLFAEPNVHWPPRLVVGRALLLRHFHETAATSRIALVWVVVEPVLLIGAIIVGYAFIGTRFILNMEVAPFAILGVASWGAMRVIAIRVGNAIVVRRDLYGLPPVVPLDVAISEGLYVFLIYTGVLILALGCAVLLGFGHGPDNILLTAAFWITLGVNAMALGFVMGYAFYSWPYARRTMPVFFRALSIVSGLVFVSEQLPTEYRPYVLWNPVLHGLQLLRSSYFEGYRSDDASIWFYVVWLVFIVAVAMAIERVMRPLLTPR